MFRGTPPVTFVTTPKDGARVRRGELRRVLAGLRPDLMITYNWGAMEAIQAVALRRFAPILHAQDGFGPDEARTQLRRRLWARRVFLRFCEAAVVPSRNLERIAHEDWWLPMRRVLYIANGIDCVIVTSAATPRRARASARRRRIAAEAFVVGMVAHLRREKNPTRLVRAFAGGAPPTESWCSSARGRKRGSRKGGIGAGVRDRLRFAGHINDPIDAYKAFDVFALCSDTEQMPISVPRGDGCRNPNLVDRRGGREGDGVAAERRVRDAARRRGGLCDGATKVGIERRAARRSAPRIAPAAFPNIPSSSRTTRIAICTTASHNPRI